MQAKFAVVGHPNKGKSSIVSTLSHNDQISISSRSGTTEKAEAYLVKTTTSAYALIDTPGFQRPTKVLQWLQQHAANASERAAVVAQFVADDTCQRQFPDEVALLKPIIDGAAILYVVDGSRPYGAEYEAEMEILRWTGQPSMALVNPIESEDCVDEWKSALAQFFKTVRVFNPFDADFDKQVELLQTFSFLNPDWQPSLSQVIEDLRQSRQRQQQESVQILVRLLLDVCSYQYCQKVLTHQQAKASEALLHKHFSNWVAQREKEAISELLSVFAHTTTSFSLDQIDTPPDLFDVDQWFAWGLNKKQLVSAATLAGAMGGAAVDMAVAGHSFMLGAIGGGLLGAGSAWFGSGKLLDLKVKGLPMGGFQACVGPIKNRNFPYVVIGRYVYLYRQIARLNHADRRALNVNADDFQTAVDNLEKNAQKTLHKACDKLIKQKRIDELDEVLSALLTVD
ncbi:GTPase/DUF3482 domain-containing protein [Alteromonas sediminis]|nr:GTPase/DUF3482 domain-containing protein [Alteromonas sediminis]